VEAVEAVSEEAAARPPMATTIDQRNGIVIHGVVYPKDPREMTVEEIREHLFLPEAAAIEVIDPEDLDGLAEVGITWAKGYKGKVVLDHVRRIIRERMVEAV
jgi:hypothetical protein